MLGLKQIVLNLLEELLENYPTVVRERACLL